MCAGRWVGYGEGLEAEGGEGPVNVCTFKMHYCDLEGQSTNR